MTWVIGTTLKKVKFKILKYEPNVILHFKNLTQLIICITTRVENVIILNFK